MLGRRYMHEFRYKYSPLPPGSIRLLQLKRIYYEDEAVQPVMFTMISRSIDSAQELDYIALSYTWDDPRPRQDHSDKLHNSYQNDVFRVECDGLGLFVRRNLYDALRRLRGNGPAAYFWVDSLCINQGDVSERNAQVELMGEIYSRSYSLLVWLGAEDKNSDRAMALIKSFGEALHLKWDGRAEETIWMNTSGFADPKVFEYFQVDLFSNDDWVCIARLLRRSWFFRSWIVQESCLPPRKAILCGNEPAPFYALTNVCGFLLSTLWLKSLRPLSSTPTNELFGCTFVNNNFRLWAKGPNSPYAEEALHRHIEHLYGINQDSSIEKQIASFAAYAVELSRPRKATDPRDKVIAILSLAAKYKFSGKRLVPLPDYTKTTEQIYTEFVRYVLLTTKRLAVLSQTEQPGESRDTDLPSWVPDFQCTGRTLDHCLLSNVKFDASRIKDVSRIIFHGSRKLELQGYVLGRVTQITKAHAHQPGYNFMASLLLAKQAYLHQHGDAWIERYLHASTANALVDQDADVLRSAFELEVVFSILSSQGIQRHGGWFHKSDDVSQIVGRVREYVCEVVQMCGESSLSPRAEEMNGIVSEIQEIGERLAGCDDYSFSSDTQRHNIGERAQPVRSAIAQATSDRYLLATDLRTIGLGPDTSSIGDEIWILPGTRVPILLRRTDQELRHVIGEVYLHGFMQGEAFDQGKLVLGEYETVVLE